MPVDAVRELEESRGYSDIDPANAWEEWLPFREWYYRAKDEG